ncbi:MAG: hypothetical protein ABFQ62_03145 [Patescibacteria group bacterium]
MDQTQFALENPILDDDSSKQSQTADSRLSENKIHSKTPDPTRVKLGQGRKKIVIFSILGFLFFLAALLALFFLGRKPEENLTDKLSNKNFPIIKKEMKFEDEFSEIYSDLKEADPALNTLPFPPVDLDFNLFVVEEE